MSSQGPTNPGTGANDATVGATAWSSPGNITGGVSNTGVGIPATNYVDNAIHIVKANGSIGTTNLSAGNSWVNGVYTNITFGGATELWGETWTPADINNSNFGAVLAVQNQSGSLSNYLKGTNFGFSIPSGATIDGIELLVQRRRSGTGGSAVAQVLLFQITVHFTPASAFGSSVMMSQIQVSGGL